MIPDFLIAKIYFEGTIYLKYPIFQLQDNGVYTVPQTQYTMDTLRLGWEQLLTNLKRAINEVEVQIMAREAHNVSETQMSDFRRCFNHFDRKRLRRLDLSEFKACLVSLGYNIPNTSETCLLC
ncbi:hypothetical protein ACTXT7_011635 [Hymenolepis weldensis]